MSCKVKIAYFCLLASLFLLSCWKKQGTSSFNPELPNYTVSGGVFDSAVNEPLPNARVAIDDTETVTDSLGQYSVPHVIGGQSHSLVVGKENFEPYSRGFDLGYADLDSFDVVLGKLLPIAERYKGPSPEPNGLIWTGDIAWASDGSKRRIYVLTGTGGLMSMKYFDPPGSSPEKGHYTIPHGMVSVEEGGTHYVWISVAYETSPPRLFKMSVRGDTTLVQEARFDTPESARNPGEHILLDDLTYDGAHIWSCSSSEDMIYQHGSDMSVSRSFEPPEEAPSGIAWDGVRFWLTTSGSNRLYMLDSESLEPMGYYVLGEAPVVGLTYKDGYLWTSKHGSQHWASWFHTYRIR